jgi:hypothetical protein
MDTLRGAESTRLIRYALVAGPAVAVIVAGALCGAKANWQRHVLPALAVLYCIVTLPQAYGGRQSWQAIATHLDRHARADEPIVFATHFEQDWYLSLMYAGVAHYRRVPERQPIVLLSQAPPQEVLDRLSQSPKVWWVGSSVDAELVRTYMRNRMPTQWIALDGTAALTRLEQIAPAPVTAATQASP